MHKQQLYRNDGLRQVDLTQPSEIVTGRLPALDAIQDRLSRQLRLDLFSYLRYSVNIDEHRTRFEKHGDLISRFESPVMIGIMRLAPLRGLSLISIDSSLVGATSDRMFGASEEVPVEREREFSPVESKIAKSLLGIVEKALRDAWSGVTEIRTQLVQTEMNASFVSVTDDREPMITMRMTVRLSTGQGDVMIAIPYPAIEPIREKLANSATLSEVRDDDKRYWHEQMSRAMQKAPVTLTAIGATARMSLQDLQQLTVGELIPIRMLNNAAVYCGGEKLADAEFGARENKIGLRIVDFHRNSQHERPSDDGSGAINESPAPEQRGGGNPVDG